MSEFIGRQIDFGVAVEAVRGTAESTADRWLRKTSVEVLPREEVVIDDSTFGRLEDAANSRSVRKWSEGSAEGVVHADTIGYFLTNLYGDVTSTVVTGSVVEHEYELAQDLTHPTLSLFVKDAGVRNVKIPGAVISSLEISATTDDYVRYNASFLGKQESSSTETSSLQTEYDFVSRDITLKVASSEAGLGAASAIKAKELTLTWESNAEADWVFGSYSPNNIYNKQFAVSGSFTRNYTDQTFESLYKSQESRYLLASIVGEANIGGGNNPELKLTGYNVKITDWTRSTGADDLVTETVSFKLFYNTTDEAQSTVTLQNLTAEYVT